MNFPESIFEFITQEENAYKTREVEIFDNYSWNMASHVQMSVSFKYSKFLKSSNDPKVKLPFRNIVLPIIRLRYRAEDIDVKDVVLYIEDPDKYHLSFLVKKYHDDVFVVENDLDSFFDWAKEEKIDLGGCLVKKGEKAVPELIPLQSIAFCDQTDILGGPIGLKFNFSPDSLRSKSKLGWGEKSNGADMSLDNLIVLAKAEKDALVTQGKQTNQTPGKNIEVYVVRGEMPESYLKSDGKDEKTVNQVQIVAFYSTKDGRTGVTLYKAKDVEEAYKFHNPEKVYGRALGLGGIEELFDAQIWTNFAEIHKTNMLKASSKVLLQTDDESYANRNKIKDMENLEITYTKEGTRIDQIPVGSPNIDLFTQTLSEWENHARELGAATDPLMGKQPPAGTPFRLQERIVYEGKGLHEYRRGKYAKFIEEIYKDWIIPYIQKEIVKGKKFLATLSDDEMRTVMECVTRNHINNIIKERILNGEAVSQEEIEAERLKIQDEFNRGGNKKWVEILKGEMEGTKLAVKVVIAGKQKDLSLLTDKLVNVLLQYRSDPALREDPIANKILNRMLEASGMSPIELGMAKSYINSPAGAMTPPSGSMVPPRFTNMAQKEPVIG